MHRRAGFHIAGTRSRPASGRRPNIAGNRLRWRTPTGIRAKFSETTGEAPTYTTAWGRLKQPDKQKLARPYQQLAWLGARSQNLAAIYLIFSGNENTGSTSTGTFDAAFSDTCSSEGIASYFLNQLSARSRLPVASISRSSLAKSASTPGMAA